MMPTMEKYGLKNIPQCMDAVNPDPPIGISPGLVVYYKFRLGGAPFVGHPLVGPRIRKRS
jgi:hypothetical protein